MGVLSFSTPGSKDPHKRRRFDVCRCAGGPEKAVCEGLLVGAAAPDGADGQVHTLVGFTWHTHALMCCPAWPDKSS